MDGGPHRGAEEAALRQYYRDHTLLLSPEWILKVLAIVGCLVTSALLVSGGQCAVGAGGAGVGAGATLLGAAAAAALVLAAAAARLPARAPWTWLIIDITTFTVMGILLLVTAVVSVAICQLNTTVAYLLLSFGVVSSALSLWSAVATYRAATRRLDAALPAREPRAPPPQDHDV